MSKYRQLPTSPGSPIPPNELDPCLDEKASEDVLHTSQSQTNIGPRLCLCIVLCCTILNALLSFLSLSIPSSSPPSSSQLASPHWTSNQLTRQEISQLRRPSQFIRFEEIARPSPPIPLQFNNYPILLAQVDSKEPKKIFEQDTRAYMARVGTISPEDRRVKVSDVISTVIQFRAIDYGMEICELRLSLPPSPSPSTLYPDQTRPLSIYRLNATLPLDPRTLSYATRPERISKIADVHYGETNENMLWHRRFSCSMEEVLTFELACAVGEGERCEVEWWQNKEHPDPAVFLTQYSTL